MTRDTAQGRVKNPFSDHPLHPFFMLGIYSGAQRQKEDVGRLAIFRCRNNYTFSGHKLRFFAGTAVFNGKMFWFRVGHSGLLTLHPGGLHDPFEFQ